ncbi:hypothetical protein OG896_24880 [Streptomyces sp. NBC_00669]|uniref:hypothetical protein n=1 Tax=Streptomyces sp. NBC_00669 TaxID=2976011 RepID=UPI002E311E83|nr:hypothetical protein [Streptomyces sp. NBC_00669]
MGIRDTLIDLLWKGHVLPARGEELVEGHRRVVRAEAFTEAADELVRIANTVETAVADHFGPASGISSGTAEMIREAAKTVRGMARPGRESKSTGAPVFFQPGHTYSHGEYRFICEHLTTHPLYGYPAAWGWFGRGPALRHHTFSPAQYKRRTWTDITSTSVPLT